MFKKVKTAILKRFGIKKIQSTILERRVAKTPWYQGDGATLLALFMVLIITGVFMTPSYSPSLAEAYESVRYITEVQVLGWLVRALHYWSAGMMVVMLFFHLFRQILVGGYKAPREGTWTIGIFLLFGVLMMAFTGYVLRWDERGIYAVKVVLNMFYHVPWIGEYLVLLAQGGSEITSATLSRFFSIHVIFIPLILLALIGYHLYLVILHGVTAAIEEKVPVKTPQEQKKLYQKAAKSETHGETFHPFTTAKSGVMAFSVFILVFGLAYFLGPQELYPKANLVTVSQPQEEWWFWWYSSLIAILPSNVVPSFIVAFPIVVFTVLLLIPLFDRSERRGVKNRPIWTLIISACVISLIYLSALRYQSPWSGWPSSELVPLPKGIQLTQEVQIGRQLFTRVGCNSCHAVLGDGPKVGPDLARISGRLSQEELKKYILKPPSGIPMPAYEGRLSEQDVNRLVDFVLVTQTFPREP